MTTEQPARRRVSSDIPTDDASGRRRVLFIGAVLGIVAGVFVALFAIPPLFDRYFGVADIELGTAYRDGGFEVRIAGVEAAAQAEGGRTVARVTLALKGDAGSWCPADDRLLLEFEGGVRAARSGGLPPLACDGNAATGTVVLEFPAAGTTPAILHSEALDARFHLQPGDPRDR